MNQTEPSPFPPIPVPVEDWEQTPACVQAWVVMVLEELEPAKKTSQESRGASRPSRRAVGSDLREFIQAPIPGQVSGKEEREPSQE